MAKPFILCVDDEKIILNSLNKQLTRQFSDIYELEFAESGEEGLEIIEELTKDGDSFAMIISDMIMPGMNGDEFLVQVHQRYPTPMKILLTGQAALDSAINTINNANLFSFIVKPWDEQDLLLTIEKGLQQYNLIQLLKKQVETFRKFVPQQFLECLALDDFEDIGAKQAKKILLSVLFSDIRQFTALSETMTPEEDFQFLNSYFSFMGEQIQKSGGFIDKFLGDGIMALFPKNATDAVEAGVAMRHKLSDYNRHRTNNGEPPIEIGIGINTGDAILGIVGAEDRVDSTVVGDTVNLASRIEGLTKFYGIPLLISEYTYNALQNPEAHHTRFVDSVKVRGKSQSIVLYEVFDADPPHIKELKESSKEYYQKAWNAFHQKEFQEAEALFKDCLQHNPHDKLSQNYLERCQHILEEKEKDDWVRLSL